MEYKCLSDFLFKGDNKNINISVSKNSPVNASLSLDGYKHSMVQIIALTIALKMKTVIVNPPRMTLQRGGKTDRMTAQRSNKA